MDLLMEEEEDMLGDEAMPMQMEEEEQRDLSDEIKALQVNT